MSSNDEVLQLVPSADLATKEFAADITVIGPAQPDRVLQVEVDNPMLAEALASSAGRAGWTAVPFRRRGGVLVTDRAPSPTTGLQPGNRVIVVCAPTPLGARCAVDSVAELMVAGVVCADDPSGLPLALDGVEAGRVTIPMRVMELAARMPNLTDRQLQLLAGVVAGQANTEIAVGMHLSEASVKRDLRVLYAALDAPTRSLLVARALDLGVAPRAIRR